MAYRFRYKNRLTFYSKTIRHHGPYGIATTLNKPNLGREGNGRFIPNETMDMRGREKMEVSEALRNPREKDFYQDHTYHDNWEEREPDANHTKQLKARYSFFDPNFAIKPWIWFPGDIVEIIDGPSAGQRGSVIAVVPYKNQLIVQNINVKDVTLPAGDGRPEQVVQREHPILANLTKHVDPSNGQLCDIRLLDVKAKNEDGSPKLDENGDEVIEQRRISMQSGTILPTPSKENAGDIKTGDPLRDTPYHDAIEQSYEADKEMSVLIERKLAALEEHFVAALQKSHNFHAKFAESNQREMHAFQSDALKEAIAAVTVDLNAKAESLDDWWFEELAPHMESLQAQDERRAEERAARRAEREAKAAEAEQLKAMQMNRRPAGDEEDMDDEEGEFEEEAEDVVEDDSNTTPSDAAGERSAEKKQ